MLILLWGKAVYFVPWKCIKLGGELKILLYWLISYSCIIPNHEFYFCAQFQAAKVPVKEYAFDDKKLSNVQSQLVCSSFLKCQLKNDLIQNQLQHILHIIIWILQEKMVASVYHLNTLAKEAYRSYILAYNAHSMKEIFNVHRLDLQVQLSHHILHNGFQIS